MTSTLRPISAALLEEQAEREFKDIKSDFRNFVFRMWEFLRLPDPTWVQYDISSYLQHGPRRRMIEAFRGVGKSWLTAAYVLWRLLKNPNERVLVVSASKERADAFSTFVKRMISEWDLLATLLPSTGMRDSNIAFDVGGSEPHQSPSVKSVGITGQITGSRATIIVADDVETPKNSLTTTMREKLAEQIKEFDAVIVPGGEIVYLGTPQTEMSLYNSLPERGYDVRVWPARYPKNVAMYADRLAPALIAAMVANPALVDDCNGRGAPTDPARFHDIDLLEREASYARSGFALQFMLDTSLSDSLRYPLKLSDLMCMGLTNQRAPVAVTWGSSPDLLAQNVPIVGLSGDRWYRPMFISKDFDLFQGVAMAIDPSGRGSDETGYAVVAMCYGFLYVLEVGGLRDGYSDVTLQTLAEVAKRNGVNHIIIEENFGGGMFLKLLTPFLVRTHPVTTEEINSSIQKEKRIIDTLEPLFNQHRVIFDEKLVLTDSEVDEPKYQLFYQLTRITKDKGALSKDDRLDALAMACGYWVEQMDKDVKSTEEERKAALLDLELEKFAAHVFGHTPSPNNWMHGNLGRLPK
jgi:hypothetical protein